MQQANPILVLGDARRGLLTTRLSQCMKSWLKEWRGAEPELDLGIRISRCDAASFATLSACDTDDLIAGQVDGVIHLAVIASPQAYQAALGGEATYESPRESRRGNWASGDS